MNEKILVVIPARGGSKGIPRKNLRTLAGKPLLYYSIHAALRSVWNPDVYVSSDDEEILSISQSLGAKVIRRDPAIADDVTTLDPVIHDACLQAQVLEGKHYDLIVTLQPTSPLLKTQSLDEALQRFMDNPALETVIAAKNDTHLTWKTVAGKYVPNYEKRVNRQYLPAVYRETGGFLITRDHIITASNRIGVNVELQLLSGGEEIDIDTYEDWHLCEYYLKRKRILFVVSGNKQIGLGHAYNTLLIANDILNHHIEFLVDKTSQMAYDKIALKNYPVYLQESDDIVEDIKARHPDVVINDRLDTTDGYMQALKDAGLCLINFEDLGNGAKRADLVINAIYPEDEILPRHYFGHKYFVLRDEFLLARQAEIRGSVKNILLTFGGVDPNNFTCKVLQAVYEYCIASSISITVITGFGYQAYDSLALFPGITLLQDAQNIAEHMVAADIIFTSAGRTTYEIAALGVPCIVLAQNEREMTHFFAAKDNGFNHLGLGEQVTHGLILDNLKQLVNSTETRCYMRDLMKQTDLRQGRARVNQLIKNILEQS